MGVLKRILLILFCVSTIVGVGYLVLLWTDVELLKPSLLWISEQSWSLGVEVVLLSITALGVLIVLFWALFSPSKSSRLILEDGVGRVVISREAILSTARCVVESHQGLKTKDIRLKISGKRHPKMRIRVKVDPGVSVGLSSLGKELTEQITASVEILTSYPLHKVRVTFTNPEKTASRTIPESPAQIGLLPGTESEPVPQFSVTAR